MILVNFIVLKIQVLKNQKRKPTQATTNLKEFRILLAESVTEVVSIGNLGPKGARSFLNILSYLGMFWA